MVGWRVGGEVGMGENGGMIKVKRRGCGDGKGGGFLICRGREQHEGCLICELMGKGRGGGGVCDLIWDGLKGKGWGFGEIQVKRVNRWTGGRVEIIRGWGLEC